MDAKIEKRLAEFQSTLVEHTRFMYLAWVSILAAVIGFGLRH